MKKKHILIVDDEKNTREGLRRALQQDYMVSLAPDAIAAMSIIKEKKFDLVLTDLRMPGLDGIQFIHALQEQPHAPLSIMLTAYGSIQTAVEAMRAGAYDYLTKPVDLDNLDRVISRALENRSLRLENQKLKRDLTEVGMIGEMIGRAPVMQEIFNTIRQIAPARSTVLISGESGTGKELVARAIHQLGNRANAPFVPVHCAALPSALLQSELFGHEKGAFTNAAGQRIGRFEAADGGIIFLDEIGEIDAAAQVMLLRFLETRAFERVGGNIPIQVDVRLIAATNRDLKKMVDEGTFREDLYYRLDVLNLRLPALRERREDIPLLLDHYLQIYKQENERDIQGFSPEALDIFTAYNWPGNVRELRNCVERMVVMAQSDTLGIRDVPEHIRHGATSPSTDHDAASASTGPVLELQTNERCLITQALQECDGNRTAAAKKLGISRRTLHRKLNEYGLRDA